MSKNKVNTTQEELKVRVDDLECYTKSLISRIEYQRGMIDGLKFVIRCNGISGAEVKE